MKKLTLAFLFALPLSGILEASSPDVKRAQYLLNKMGFNAGVEDGLYGRTTQNALIEFYRTKNKTYDGNLNDKKIEELESEYRKGTKLDGWKIGLFPVSDKNLYYPFCQIDKLSVEQILDIAAKRDGFRMLDMWHESESDFHAILNNIEWYSAEYWAYPSQQNASKLKQVLLGLFQQEFASTLQEFSSDDSMLLEDFLLASLYSYGVLLQNEEITENEKEIFSDAFKSRLKIISKSPRHEYNMSKCVKGQNLFSCQNHTYQKQHIRTVYGIIFNSSSDYKMGEAIYKFALEDLKPDGALWREAVRSKWAWRYYPHALGHLISIAEVYRLNGTDLYSFESKGGHTIHDAIGFFIKSLQDNDLMWSYAKQIKGVDHYKDFKNYKSKEYVNLSTGLEERGGYKNWYYIYRSVFSDHPNVKIGDTLIPTFQKQMESTNHLGFIAQCTYSQGGDFPKQDIIDDQPMWQKEGILRSAGVIKSRARCLNDFLKATDKTIFLNPNDINVLEEALEKDVKRKTKRHLIKFGLNSAMVEENKKALLRLVNFKGDLQAYCEKPLL